MLKNIPSIISPELLMILMEMGHGDEIILADANYPAESAGVLLIRADGHGILELLEAILKFFPLDSFATSNILYMDSGQEQKPLIWKRYETILKDSGETFQIEKLKRFQFYERARQAFAIVASGEKSLYANVILKKGIVQ